MDIETTLKEIEEKIQRGSSPRDFWRIVERVKKDPELVEKYAERIGRIDQQVFRDSFTLGVAPGNLLALLGVAASLGMLLWSPAYRGPYPWALPMLAALLLSSAVHPLAHYLAGKLLGIRFTFYFLNGPLRIEPTLKTDYASYLRAPPKNRVAMHLAGAVATTISPLILLVIAFFLGLPEVSLLALGALALFFLGTEFVPLLLLKLGSLKILGMDFRKSDSYRAMREWRLAG